MDRVAQSTLAACRPSPTEAAAEGRSRPFVIPHYYLVIFILPTLWLAIPHTRRPRLYQTRWLVMAAVAIINVHNVFHTGSTDVAYSVFAGTTGTWATMICMNFLIWSRPQFDAARVLKLSRRTEQQKGQGSNTEDRASVVHQRNGAQQNGLPKRNGMTVAGPRLEGNGGDEFYYVWQRFPEDAPFMERLGWVIDLMLTPRGAGWNWSISSVPRPDIPQRVQDGERVAMESIPRITKSGFQRSISETEFAYTKFKTIMGCYVLLDLTSTLMVKDPYFVVGPDQPHQRHLLPRYLQGLPPWLLLAYREVLSLMACLSQILFGNSLIDLMQYWTLRTLFPSRSGLWMHASTFGSFSQVLDRGLSGWWGAFWHQTFRVPFLAPATFLIREGYIEAGTAVADATSIFVSFLQSGLLHASGSLSSVANTKPWQPLQFFLLQAVGVIVQRVASNLLRQRLPLLPKRLRRGANLAFTLVWLYLTVTLYFDDVASTGLWALRPVPVSLFRGLRLGSRNDRWWQWVCHNFAWWQRWWHTGVAVFAAAALAYVYSYICESLRHAAKARQFGCKSPVHGFYYDPTGLVGMLLSAQAARHNRLPDHIDEQMHKLQEQQGRFHSTVNVKVPLFRNIIFTVDPQNIQAVLAIKFKDFEYGPNRIQNFKPLLGNGIFAANGKQWERSRALLRPQFVRSQVSNLELEEAHVKALMTVLEWHLGAGGWTDLVDLQVLFFRLSLDSATEFLFGESVNSQLGYVGSESGVLDANQEVGFAEAFDRAQFTLSLAGMLGSHFWLLHTPEFKRTVSKVHAFVDYFVQRALEKGADEEQHAGPAKEKYVFLDALARETQDRTELRSQLLNILLAGRDSTASTLSWFFLTMADIRYQPVFRRLREVILDEFGIYSSPKDISFERIKGCQYLQWCINECLRLYPIVPINLRTANVDTCLPTGGGPDGQSPVYVKKGQDVFYSVHTMQRRKDLWGPDADVFNPDRWTERRPGWDYLPFNGGPRICIGQQFALTEIAYVIIRLMQRIDAIDGSQVGPVRHRLTLSNCPADGVKVRLHVASINR